MRDRSDGVAISNNMISYLKKNWWWLSLLAVILIVAAYLRLYNIAGYMTFLGDEGRDVMVVRKMIMTHRPTFLGPTASVGGFFLGPIYYYFILPFLWLWKLDPTGPAVMVALFGVATVYVVFRVGRDFFGTAAGLIAAALYALSPVVIAYSRSSWNPNPVPFFATLAIYISWRAIVKDEWRGLFWIGLCLGIGLQLHYLFIFLFPVIGAWFLLYGKKKTAMKYYLFGVLGFLVGFGPFLLFELVHRFPNTQSIIRFILAGNETGFTWELFRNTLNGVSFRLFGRLVLRLPQPEVWNELPSMIRFVWTAGVNFLLWGGFGLAIYTFFRDKGSESNTHKKTSVLLVLWYSVILVLFGFYRRGIYDYYFGIFFTLPFLLTGFIASFLLRSSIGKVVVLLSIGYLLWFNWQGRPFIYGPNNQLAQAKRISKAAFEKAEGKPFNFALLTSGNSDHAFRYFFEVWGNKPVTIETEAVDPERKTITDQLIVICEEQECKPLGHPLWEIAGFGKAQIVGEWDVPWVKIFKLVHYEEAAN